ncbi:MAG: ribosome silencing factor [Myxococcales bacterium]|nr:ribosome silencing factor [Myxococcales bacterium]
MRRDQARQVATWVALLGLEKKAERVEVIDLAEKVDYADFIVLMSGRSDRQVQAIANGVTDGLRERGVRPVGVEGLTQGHWVVVDLADVIVHVFIEEARQYYDIEGLWMDARRVPYEGAVLPPMRVKARVDEVS